jgi:predicted kinase
MNGKLYVMIGAPGSGKSTWIANHSNPKTDKVISRDALRFELLDEGEDYFTHEVEVFREFVYLINEAIEQGYNVFADATHISVPSRSKLLSRIDSNPSEINAIFIKKPLEVCLAQNENRKDTQAYVPRSVVGRMHASITRPTFEEGFNRIYVVEDNKPIVEYLEEHIYDEHMAY